MAQERIPHLDMQWASQTKILQLQFVTCILLEVENDIKPGRIILGEKASKKKVLPFAGTVRIGSCRRRRHCGSSSPDRSPPAVGVAFLAAAPAPTANAAGQRSEPIWWSRMPQKQSTVSHVALGRGSATPRLSSAAPSASTHLWLSYGTMGPYAGFGAPVAHPIYFPYPDVFRLHNFTRKGVFKLLLT